MIPFVCRRILKRRQKCYDSLNCQMCHRLRSIHASYVAYVHKVHTFTFGTMFGQYLPSCRRTYIVHAVHVVSRQGHATAQNTKKFGHYAFVVNCCQVFAHYRIARARSLYNNWFSFKIGLKCGAHTHGDANRFIEAKIARTIFFFIHISSYFFFFYLFLLLESLACCASRNLFRYHSWMRFFCLCAFIGQMRWLCFSGVMDGCMWWMLVPSDHKHCVYACNNLSIGWNFKSGSSQHMTFPKWSWPKNIEIYDRIFFFCRSGNICSYCERNVCCWFIRDQAYHT